MKKLLFIVMACLSSAFTYSQTCDVEITNFNWDTYTATIDIDCDEGVSELTLYLGNSDLDNIPPCGNFSQNVNWPEYTFTFFNNLNITQGTIELNIFDAWNNIIANPYTIAECWVQLYENGFTCEGGEIGIWQVNIGEALGDSYITFDGLCPCDTITEIVYETDTIIEYETIVIYETDTLWLTEYIYETDTVEVIVYEYIIEYVNDTITEFHTITEYIDCETGEPCENGFNPCDETSIYAPNAVTPNDDGWNDTWLVVAEGGCWDFWEVRIYNRWGGLVWISSNSTDEWNANVATGVYVYTIKASKDNPLEFYEFNGTVTVLY